MAALDSKNKRRAIINMISRHSIGLVADNNVELNDTQNYAWIYPFLTYPADSGGGDDTILIINRQSISAAINLIP